jgi:hypothetical protein
MKIYTMRPDGTREPSAGATHEMSRWDIDADYRGRMTRHA